MPLLDALNIPYTRPRYVLEKWGQQLDEKRVAAQRITLISIALNKSVEQVEALVAKYDQENWQGITFDHAREYNLYGMPVIDRVTLYTLIWALEPEICIETGAASGMAATMILSYLRMQQNARLYSIDLDDGIRNKDYGVLIPDDYRSRWELRLQKNEPILPALLDEVGEIDFFLHDSRHTAQHMTWEYEVVWPYIKSGGCLASHDIWFSTSFDLFKKKHASEISGGGAIGNFGFLVKAA